MTYKTCYYAIHIDGEEWFYEKRKEITKKIHETISNKIDRIDGESIKIFSFEDMYNFKKYNKKYNVFQDKSMYPVTDDQWLRTMGLWASNYLTLKKFLNSNYESIIIFEDDVELSENFVDGLYGLLDLLPRDWDLFVINNRRENDIYYQEEVHSLDNSDICKNFYLTGSACNVYSVNGAKKIVDYIENHGVYVAYDWALYHKQYGLYLKIFGINPNRKQITKLISGVGSSLLNEW